MNWLGDKWRELNFLHRGNSVSEHGEREEFCS
jgi:hypothetical protein